MVISAAQRVRGHLTDSERNEIAFIGIEFVRAGYSILPALQISYGMLAASVEQLAMQIDASEWTWAVDYESGAWQQQDEEDDEICTGSICFEGIRYQVSTRTTSQRLHRCMCLCPGEGYWKWPLQDY